MGHIDSIINMIEGGHVDDDLSEIIQAIQDRRREIDRDRMAELRQGMRVRIRWDAPLKPRYILGATGTVVNRRVSKVTVLLDADIHDPYGKWAGRQAVLSAGVLEILEDERPSEERPSEVIVTEIPIR